MFPSIICHAHPFQSYATLAAWATKTSSVKTPLIDEAGKMLTKVNVEKMPFYQLGMEKGMKKGMEKGIEKGMEKGMIEAMHENILEILTLRFEHVPNDCRSKIAAETDLQRLQTLLRRAVKIESTDQLFQ